MLRVIAFFISFLLPLLGFASAAAPTLDLTSDSPIVFDEASKEMIAVGNAQLTYGDVRLSAGELRYNQQTGLATAKHGLVVTQGPLRLIADEGSYSVPTGMLRMKNVRAGQHPLYFSGDSLEGDTREFIVRSANITYGEPRPLTPAVFANKLTVRPGVDYKASGAHLRLFDLPFMPLPRHSVNLGASPVNLSLKLGYRSNLGAYAQLTTLVPLAKDVSAGAVLGAYSGRGFLVGPVARYNRTSGGSTISGSLRTGFISDHGDRDTDILGRPISHDRGFIDWKHLQQSGDFSLATQLNYWSDSEIVRDFDRDNFSNSQQPDTFLEATYRQPNWQLSFFSRAQVNRFHAFQQRLPELRFDMASTPLGLGILQRAHASYAHLRESGELVTNLLESQRLDASYTLSRPTRLSNWLTLTPVAGGRITHYAQTSDGSPDYTRVLGELGLDARAQFHATFDYENPTWKIKGLRHLLEPFLNYRWVPGADNGHSRIPQIDRQVFATRLQPLGLADIRNIDDLRPHHTVRLGLDNRIQTQDSRYGVRDLASLTIAADGVFSRLPGEDRVSDIHLDLALHPAPWISLEVYQRSDLDATTLNELVTSITLRDGEHWTARVSSHFLRHDLESYSLDMLARLSERFALTGRWEYDAHQSRFTEQRYGVRQTIQNLWAINYEIAFHEGLLRESSTHFRIAVDILSF